MPHAEARALFAAIRAIAQLTDDDSAPDETGDGNEGGASAIDRSLSAANESRFAVAGATSGRHSESAHDELRVWVESKYTRLPLREKDAGPRGY